MRRSAEVSLAVVLAAACLTAGCASIKTTEWTGHRIDEAVKEFGTPTRTVPSLDGKTMYVWERPRTVSESSTEYGPAGRPVTRTVFRTTRATWTFLVDQNGTIMSWNRSDATLD